MITEMAFRKPHIAELFSMGMAGRDVVVLARTDALNQYGVLTPEIFAEGHRYRYYCICPGCPSDVVYSR